MALQISGAISFGNINTELGNSSSATLSIGGTAARTLAGIASGAISMSDFYGKSSASFVYNNGQPWKQQYSFNTSQTAVLGTWTTSATGLYLGVRSAASLVTNCYAYILGGRDNSNIRSTIQMAPVNSDGTLGSWVSGGVLPASLTGGQVVLTKNRIYYIGGNTGSVSSVVYTAPINSDGTLGSWTTGNSLVTAVSEATAVITNNRIYLLGGTTNAAAAIATSVSGAVSTVQTATIDSNGLIGTWSTTTSLPAVLCYSALVQTLGRVYLLGGCNASGGISTVYTAPVNTDGTLGSWTTGVALPIVHYGHQAVIVHTKAYIFGISGKTNVYYATVASDGTIGTWSAGTALASYQGYGTVVITSSRLYLFGGNTGGVYQPRISYVAFAGGLNNYLTSSYS